MFKRKRFLIPLGLFVALGVPTLILSRAPDFELHMVREVPSPTAPDELAPVVGDPAQWPKWFHLTTAVQDRQDGTFRLTVDPNKGEWKKFTLDLRVLSNAVLPNGGRKLELELIGDSKQKLRKMFSHLRWEIEILPGDLSVIPGGRPELSRVRGTVYARTSSWRARLFGRMSPRILLNQALYPDLIGLAEVKQGKPVPALRMGM